MITGFVEEMMFQSHSHHHLFVHTFYGKLLARQLYEVIEFQFLLILIKTNRR